MHLVQRRVNVSFWPIRVSLRNLILIGSAPTVRAICARRRRSVFKTDSGYAGHHPCTYCLGREPPAEITDSRKRRLVWHRVQAQGDERSAPAARCVARRRAGHRQGGARRRSSAHRQLRRTRSVVRRPGARRAGHRPAGRRQGADSGFGCGAKGSCSLSKVVSAASSLTTRLIQSAPTL